MKVLLLILALGPLTMLGEEKFTRNQIIVGCLKHKTKVIKKLHKVYKQYSFNYMNEALMQISCFEMADMVVGNNAKNASSRTLQSKHLKVPSFRGKK